MLSELKKYARQQILKVVLDSGLLDALDLLYPPLSCARSGGHVRDQKALEYKMVDPKTGNSTAYSTQGIMWNDNYEMQICARCKTAYNARL